MPHLDVDQAIRAAKSFVLRVLAEEEPVNVGLEEVEFDDRTGIWQVTIGFSRPWDRPGALFGLEPTSSLKRAYRVVTVSDSSGEAISMKRRDVADVDA